jgi:WD40 repeat protein
MADIFISHSGTDNEAAAALGKRIRNERPSWSLFYDKDNIRAGQRWQERLREELQSCRMVVVLLSRNWLASPWCFTEAVTAAFRGKDVVAIETEDLTSDDLARAPPIVHERQRLRLRDGDDRAFQEFLEALDRSGLDPNDWFPIPPNVGPYPGLVAFDEKDAGVFFGRKQEITEYLGILDTLRGPDRSQVLVISGASGSGKSSLLRAGLIPRLRRKPEWVVINPFEIASDPIRNLFHQLGVALARAGISTPGRDLQELPLDAKTLVQTLDSTLWRLEQTTGAWVLLPLDQAEALVVRMGQGERAEKDPQAELMLGALGELLGRRTRHVVVVATIRSEFVPSLEANASPKVRLRHAPLSPIGSFAEAVEKPADRFGLTLEPGLVQTLVEDVKTADALPLLAYTLKLLFDCCKPDSLLTLDAYRTLGGVHGAIREKLASVLSDPKPTTEQLSALRRAFTRHLIQMDDAAIEGERLLRRVVQRESLPPEADPLVCRLVNAGLLTSRDSTIEIAHERVISNWPNLPISDWLKEDATDRRLIDQLRQRQFDDSLPDGLHSQAEELLQRDPALIKEEPAIVRLVQRSKDVRRKRELEYDRKRTRLLAMQARRAVGEADKADSIERGAALALESIAIARNGNQSSELDAIEASRIAMIRLPLRVLEHGSVIRSLVVLADGRLASGGEDGRIKLWPRNGEGDSVSLSHGSPVLSLAKLDGCRFASGGADGKIKIWSLEEAEGPLSLHHGGKIQCLVVLKDGRLASAGDGVIRLWSQDLRRELRTLFCKRGNISLAELTNGQLAAGCNYPFGQIQLWQPDGSHEPEVLTHRTNFGAVPSLVALADDWLGSGGADGNIKLWPPDREGDPVVLNHGDAYGGVRSLALLADGRLASAGGDGVIKLWPKGNVGEPVILSHGSRVPCLVVMADGRFASGGEDGQIKLWPADGAGEPGVLSHDRITSLAVLAGGRLASGGADGKIKVWPRDGAGEPVILLHGSAITSLVVLEDGRLASGDKDYQIKLWPRDLVGEPLILWQGDAVTSLAALTNGRLASGGFEHGIKVWPRDGAGEPVILRDQVWLGVRSLAALADGRLVSASGNKVKIWTEGGIGDPEILSHGARVLCLVETADERLAIGGEDGQITLWPADDAGEPSIVSHGSPTMSLAVLADGRLVSGGLDGKIKLWPRDGDGEPVILSHGSPVSALVALTDGRLASGGGDQVKIWLVEEEKLIAALCLRAGRNLTRDEWVHYIGSDIPWQRSCRNRLSNWRSPSA